jgi:hypothetical protein
MQKEKKEKKEKNKSMIYVFMQIGAVLTSRIKQ